MDLTNLTPKIKKVYCLNRENPLGITQIPEFSFEAEGDFTAVRILCKSETGEIVWDKVIQTTDCFGIVYQGRALRDCERITYWIGCYYGENFAGFSEPAFFEMGINAQNFQAKWVFNPDFGGESPVFLHAFGLKKKVKNARLYIAGLGYFDAYVNGKSVDKQYFKPVVTVYDDRPLNGIIPYYFNRPEKRIYYHTYDVTSFLEKENLLAVALGGGWYYNVEKEMEGNYSYATPRAIYEIHVTYKDGTNEVFLSGKNTKLAPCHIRKSTLFKGEEQDFNFLKPEDYTVQSAEKMPLASVLANPPAGRLEGNIWPCDIVKETLMPVSERKKENRIIVDFGRNHAGVIHIRAFGNKGDKMVVKSAENLTMEGELDHLSTGWNYLIETDSCTFSGKEEIFSPRFTFHGYRYAEITLEGDIEVFEIKSLVLSSDVEKTGVFDCSESILNDIYQMYVHTQESNLHGCIPSDCPHREKRGFTGDGQVTCASAICAFDMRAFYKKWMQDIADCQDKDTGSVPHTAPYSGGGCSPGFGSAVAIIPMEYFKYYADVAPMKKYLPNILDWIKYLNNQHKGDFIVVKEEREWSLGEWFCPDKIEIPREYVKTYFFAKSCQLALQIMRITKEYTHYQEIETLYGQIKQAMKKVYFDGNDFCGGKNGANLFALDCGVFNGAQRKKLVESTLSYYRSTPVINTGIFGTRLLLEFLTQNGAKDIAYKIITSKEHPSYGFMLVNGATTLWECWEKVYTPEFCFSQGKSMKGYPASHNHPMLGSFAAWLYTAVGGLNFDCFGQTRTVIFYPRFAEYVSKCEVRQMTSFGKVALQYSYKDGEFDKFEVLLPANTYGVAILDTQKKGKKIISLRSGKYSLI